MQISTRILRKFLNINLTDEEFTEQLINKLNIIGFEVEEVLDYPKLLKNIVTAQILEVKKHPNATSLNLCMVSDGSSTFQIVCGCSSVHTGMFVALAKIGAHIPNGNFNIKKSKIRGELSEGMLCSLEELNLSLQSSGILNLITDEIFGLDLNSINSNELNRNIKLGTEIVEFLNLSAILKIAVTPNRGDMMSVYGIARELSHFDFGQLYDTETIFSNFSKINPELEQVEWLKLRQVEQLDLKQLDIGQLKQQLDIKEFFPAATMKIKVNDNSFSKRCYFAKFDFLNQISPKWLLRDMYDLGLKTISAAVDITNYVSQIFGHPSHIYGDKSLDLEVLLVNQIDRNHLNSNNLMNSTQTDQVNCNNSKSINFCALDEKNYALENDDIVIFDSKNKTIEGLAGIMGGKSHMCKLDSEDGILEMGHFDQNCIAQTGQRLNITSKARQKYERGIEVDRMKLSFIFCLKLFEIVLRAKNIEIIKYINSSTCINSSNEAIEQKFVLYDSEIQKFLGFLPENIENIFNKMGFSVQNGAQNNAPNNIQNNAQSSMQNGASSDNIKNGMQQNGAQSDILSSNIKNSGQANVQNNIQNAKNNEYTILVPQYRQDIENNLDIISEIARFIGYDNFLSRPVEMEIAPNKTLKNYSQQMISNHYHEVITWSFISKKYFDFITLDEKLSIKNPISSNLEILRNTAVSNFLDIYSRVKKLSNEFAIFEIGPSFYVDSTENISQDEVLFGMKEISLHTYDFCEIQELIRDIYAITQCEIKQILDFSGPKYFDPKVVAEIEVFGKKIGHVGFINKNFMKMFNLSSDINLGYFEINLSKIENLNSKTKSNFKIESGFLAAHPVAIRDFSFLMSEDFNSLEFNDFIKQIHQFGLQDQNTNKTYKIVKDIKIFDLYHENKQNRVLGIRIWLQHLDKTLTDEEINSFQDYVIEIAKVKSLTLKRDR